MPRKSMNDIVPRDGRTIRNIPIPETRVRVPEPKPVKKERISKLEEDGDRVKLHYAKETPREEEIIEEVRKDFERPESHEEIIPENNPPKEKKSRKSLLITIGTIVGVLILAFVASTVFHSATLTVAARALSVAVANDFTAKKTAGLTDLPFEVVTIKQTASETVKATGEKQVDKKATGTIIIYNNYSTASQRLIKNTRFSTAEGLIFRISESVTVPGKKGTVPGSVEAVITADESGDKYNVGLKDFSIPGFKGDPRYTAFYARSKTALAGGFSGKQKVVADADRAKAKAAIESKLTTELMKLAPGQVAANKISFDGAYKIDFNALPEESVSTSEVTLKEEGVLSLVIFDKQKLSAAVAKSYIKDYKNEPILITNLDKLTFVPKTEVSSGTETLAFKLSGDASFEWIYDELSLKQALLSKPRADIPATLQKFPMIEKADISIRPFWIRKFPSSLERITIEKK